MKSLFQKALSLIGTDSAPKKPVDRPLKTFTERELLVLESEIGSKLFGEIPAGVKRQFFCLDQKTWMWYEEWIDPVTKKKMSATTRYEIVSTGIIKVQEGARYSLLEGQELNNLVVAIGMYYEQVARGVYSIDPATGKKIA